MKDVIPDIIRNKKTKGSHPNLLAINMLLSKDFQIAKMLRFVKIQFSADNFKYLDGLLITTCGIDKMPRINKQNLLIKAHFQHPILKMVESKT